MGRRNVVHSAYHPWSPRYCASWGLGERNWRGAKRKLEVSMAGPDMHSSEWVAASFIVHTATLLSVLHTKWGSLLMLRVSTRSILAKQNGGHSIDWSV